ncbi:DUF4157 domain-containing protein [Nostoc sp. UIC 10607]|uniref:eCIS core domain-containing protein n=1 Tax=Nostoc sp. UIC 10607 TaxID=3045935 RepID=UPI0039A3598B
MTKALSAKSSKEIKAGFTKARSPQSKQQPNPYSRVFSLQRTVGNRAVEQILGKGAVLQRKCACGGDCPSCKEKLGIQTKLKISEPGDRYEQEADRIADEVMRIPEPSVQRQTEPEEEDEEMIQRKAMGNPVAPFNTKQESLKVPPIVHEVLNSPGQPLDSGTCTFMESHFGQDFSQVRVHTDTKAAESARAVKALAYTVQQDIVFGVGQYAPESSLGKKLIAHELTHIVQQQRARFDSNRISRVPEKSYIEDGSYSYSTHCGWIDWGHANPGLARNLIAIVREASQRMARKESTLTTQQAAQASALTKQVAAESPSPFVEAQCKGTYEKNEVADSAREQPVMTTQEFPSGLVVIWLGGFGVNSDDSSKFVPFTDILPATLQAWTLMHNKPFKVILTGYSDCIGAESQNQKLRRNRSNEIAARLATASARVQGADPVIFVEFRDAPLNQYLASNATRQGRRVNRGVRLQFVPDVAPATPAPERVTLPQMKSSKFGVVISGVTPTIQLNRSLSETEVLQVALGIFMFQSYVFESLQSWTDRIKKSSFSEEDLPSNLIGFYRAAYGYSQDDVRQICDAWDAARSLQAYKGYAFRQNRTFRPLSLPLGGSWPAQFSTIPAIQYGSSLYSIVELLIETPFMEKRMKL